MKLIFFLLPVFLLSSCSLMIEAADISVRRSKQIDPSEVQHGDGFTVRAPEASLYPRTNYPTKGGITLRPTDTFRDGLVYCVTPFSSAAKTPDEALNEWNEILRNRSPEIKVLEKSKANYSGLRATRAVVEIPHAHYSHVASVLVTKRGKDFLILSRGDVIRPGFDRSRVLALCKQGLTNLMENTTITRRD